jgi:hypothetical protein
MKNKKSIYILLPLVLLIWGTIIYQFFSYTNPESAIIPSQDYSVKPLIIKQKDSITININPRDPFSGKMIDDGVKKETGKKRNTKIPKIKKELIWPQISYKGIVSDNKDKIKVYMVIINGKTNLMKKGDTEEGILLKEGDREIIYLKFKGDDKVVFIQP